MSRDELFVLWSAARAEANMAYDAWCDAPGRMTYAAVSYTHLTLPTN